VDIRRPRYFVLAGSKVPFSLEIGEPLAVDCLKKAAKDERMLELGPFDMAVHAFYKSTKLDQTIRGTSTNGKIYPSICAHNLKEAKELLSMPAAACF